MKIGPRITLATVSLVVLTLGLYGSVSVRNRRVELQSDAARHLSSIGGLMRVTLEAAIRDGLFNHGLFEDLGPLIARWQAAEPDIRYTYIDLVRTRGAGFQVAAQHDAGTTPDGPSDLGVPAYTFVDSDALAHEEPGGEKVSVGSDVLYLPPSRDPTRQVRLHRAVVEGLAYGEHAEIDGRPVYAVMEPIHDGDGNIVGALELVRDEGETIRALRESVLNVVYAVGGLGLMLTVLVWISAVGGISSPLKRLLEAIGDVGHGDLGRVILRERNDEVGDLAERFNEMTHSLREARKEILSGVDTRVALESSLRKSEKLATIGQLAASIAHEVGTPLNVISGRARNMEKRADDALSEHDPHPLQPVDVQKNAGIIAVQTQSITKIIQQLLDFARRSNRVRGPVDMRRVIQDTLDFLEHQLLQSGVEVPQIEFTRAPAPDEAGAPAVPERPTVIGDADQLQQVCLNLCVNAVQAMPTGGRLVCSLVGVVQRRPGLDAAPMGGFIVLSVADTGIGIPLGDRERIFEPFYTTKTPSEDEPAGSGLGLAVSNGIVKDHDGWIELEAPATGGTVFRVYLPSDA